MINVESLTCCPWNHPSGGRYFTIIQAVNINYCWNGIRFPLNFLEISLFEAIWMNNVVIKRYFLRTLSVFLSFILRNIRMLERIVKTCFFQNILLFFVLFLDSVNLKVARCSIWSISVEKVEEMLLSFCKLSNNVVTAGLL